MFNNADTIAIAMKIPSGICENSPRKENLSTMQNNQFVGLKINLADHWEIRLSSFSVCIKGYSRTCI